MLSVLRYRQGEPGTLRFGGLELLDGWQRGGDEEILADEHRDVHDRVVDTLRLGREALQQQEEVVVEPLQLGRMPVALRIVDRECVDAKARRQDFALFGQNFFVTRHALPSPSIERVRGRIEDGQFDTSRATKHLCYRVVRTIIDRYSPIVLSLESRLEDMEEEMLEAPSDALLAELVSYNSRLKKLRRTFGHQDTLLHELLHSVQGKLSPPSQHEFQDAHEQMSRIASLTAMLQELTRDLIDGYLSISAHRLNNIMKVLTIASVIFLPLTFIAGIYGMNFANMPELQSRNGYFVVLGVLASLAVVLLSIFRRLRWL